MRAPWAILVVVMLAPIAACSRSAAPTSPIATTSPAPIPVAWLALSGRTDEVFLEGVNALLAQPAGSLRGARYTTAKVSSPAMLKLGETTLVIGVPQDPTGMLAMHDNISRLIDAPRTIAPGSEPSVLLAADELLAGVMESGEDFKDPTVYGFAVMGRRLILDEMLRLDPPPISEDEIRRRRDLYDSLTRDPRHRPSIVP